jgi:hypothetical protein
MTWESLGWIAWTTGAGVITGLGIWAMIHDDQKDEKRRWVRYYPPCESGGNQGAGPGSGNGGSGSHLN